jgi:biopolymer transport protein TolR
MSSKILNKDNGLRRKRSLNSDINITPMVDVMLVLLIIFMVTAPMLVSGVKVDLPETSSAPVEGNDEPLSISIDSAGRIYIMETIVSKAELLPKLIAISDAKKDSRIFVRGDKSLSYGIIMEVVSMVSESGFTKVALVTDSKE